VEPSVQRLDGEFGMQRLIYVITFIAWLMRLYNSQLQDGGYQRQTPSE